MLSRILLTKLTSPAVRACCWTGRSCLSTKPAYNSFEYLYDRNVSFYIDMRCRRELLDTIISDYEDTDNTVKTSINKCIYMLIIGNKHNNDVKRIIRAVEITLSKELYHLKETNGYIPYLELYNEYMKVISFIKKTSRHIHQKKLIRLEKPIPLIGHDGHIIPDISPVVSSNEIRNYYKTDNKHIEKDRGHTSGYDGDREFD